MGSSCSAAGASSGSGDTGRARIQRRAGSAYDKAFMPVGSSGGLGADRSCIAPFSCGIPTGNKQDRIVCHRGAACCDRQLPAEEHAKQRYWV